MGLVPDCARSNQSRRCICATHLPRQCRSRCCGSSCLKGNDKMIFNIVRKELKSMFASPMGWIILAIFTALFGSLYLNGVNGYFEVMSGAVRPAERVGVTQFVGQTVYGWAFLVVLFA